MLLCCFVFVKFIVKLSSSLTFGRLVFISDPIFLLDDADLIVGRVFCGLLNGLMKGVMLVKVSFFMELTVTLENIVLKLSTTYLCER